MVFGGIFFRRGNYVLTGNIRTIYVTENGLDFLWTINYVKLPYNRLTLHFYKLTVLGYKYRNMII